MKNIFKNPFVYIAITFLLALSSFLFQTKEVVQDDNAIGIANTDSSWIMIDKFSGYQTKVDETKLPDGANGRGQNTTTNEGDRISIRENGIELFPEGTASTSDEAINTMHTFRKKDGESVLMRTRSTVIEYFEETGDVWATLKGGYTADQTFGFADYNKTNDITSYTYFGNAIEPFSRWTGVHTVLSATATSGASVVFVADAGDFGNTGTIVVCGTEYAYTSKISTAFTLTGTISAECASGSGVPEAVEIFATNPKGNIYIAFDNRLLIAGVASTSQAVYFSKYGEPTTYLDLNLVSASTDADADIFNLVEGGGAVTGLAMDENALYIFKKSIVYRVTLTDTDYTVTQLKPFDGRSQTAGLVTAGGTFSGGNEIFFITPDNQIMSIQRIENVDFPQIEPISDNIKNTVDILNFDEAKGIVFRDKAYFSCKSNQEVTFNDTVLVWNIRERTWDSPIIGWNASDFAVYDDGTGENLYLSDDISPNTYRLSDDVIDDTFEVKANWRSKQFSFNSPEALKAIDSVFIEGYISQNTNLKIMLLLDEDGYTESFSTTFSGTETDFIYNSDISNVFGMTPFGAYRFGSYDVANDKKKFRMYLNKDFRALPFYNLQLDFSSEGINEQWEITSFGFHVKNYPQPVKRSLIRSFQ